MVTENTNLCTGCGVCAAICPKKCLKMGLSEDGFYVPKLDDPNACVHCGICEKVCPKNIVPESIEPKKLLSAYAKDKEILATTSSGGVCYELAKSALENGKKVCACVYDYQTHRAVHAVISNIRDLDATKGSKYFQSYTPEAFSKLFNGEEWVVFGSPCQIAAVAKAAEMRKIRDKFVLVDFFCHGTPSMNIWKKYISENGGDDIARIIFRSKEFGWHNFSLSFTYKDGTKKSDYQDNMFYKFFFNNLCLNDSCYQCNFKAFKSMSDIRVGDFWGTKYRNNRTGVSSCALFTERGVKALAALQDRCEFALEKAEDVMEEQMHVSPPLLVETRKKVMKAIKGKKSLKTINNTTLFMHRVRCKLKSMLRRK